MNFEIIRKEYISDVFNEIGVKITHYNFIAIVYSSWHLDNLNVFLDHKKLFQGVILIFPQSDIADSSRFRLNESNFTRYEYSKCKIYQVNSVKYDSSLKNLLLRIISFSTSSEPFYLINSAGINLKLFSLIPLTKKKIVCVKIDEGTGSYISNVNYNLNKRGGEKGNLLLYYVKAFIRETLKELVIMLLRLKKINFLMFVKHNEMLFPNPIVCEGLYSNYMRYRCCSNRNKSIILFKDDGLLDEHILNSFYNDLFKQLSKLNIPIIVKKHPNDLDIRFDQITKSYSNIEIINYKKGGEQLVADYEPVLIIGGLSTVIFSAASIFKIKTYSYMLMYKNFNELPLFKRDLIDDFYKMFKNSAENLCFIKNFDQIK